MVRNTLSFPMFCETLFDILYLGFNINFYYTGIHSPLFVTSVFIELDQGILQNIRNAVFFHQKTFVTMNFGFGAL